MENNNLIELFNRLEIISSIGIDSLIVAPGKEGGTSFRGVDEKQSIILNCNIDESIVDYELSIYSLRVLLSRMRLFEDLTKVDYSFKLKDSGDSAKRLELQSNEADVSYTFSEASALKVPSTMPLLQTVESITFDKDNFQHLVHAVRSMRLSKSYDEKIIFANNGTDVYYELNDGIADKFTRTICKTSAENKWKHKWRTDSVEKLIKQSLQYNDTVDLVVTDKGVAIVTVSDLKFMIAPE